MTPPTRTCCCPSTDRHECIRLRYGIRVDDYDGALEEGCTCACHDEHDEQVREEMEAEAGYDEDDLFYGGDS